MSRITEGDILEGDNEVAAAILLAGHAIAYQIKNLGLADAATPMGAIESHGTVVKDAAERIAGAIEELADAVSALVINPK